MITALQAIQKLPTDINFSEEKLSANIPATEYKWGLKFLGKDFWNDLVLNINTNTDYKVLFQQVLWDYLAWALLFESRFNIQWSISTQGFMLNNTEFSQSDRNAYKNISQFLYDRVVLYQQKLNDFLTTYPSRFSLYGPNEDSCCSRPQYIEDFLGVNIDIVHNKCCSEDNTEPDFPDYIEPIAKLRQFNINCPSSITINGIYKNDILQDNELPKEFDNKDSLIEYLQGLNSDWELNGNYVQIQSTDIWNLLICCSGN